MCNNAFTLSGKGFPCQNDPTNKNCAWCTKTGFQWELIISKRSFWKHQLNQVFPWLEEWPWQQRWKQMPGSESAEVLQECPGRLQTHLRCLSPREVSHEISLSPPHCIGHYCTATVYREIKVYNESVLGANSRRRLTRKWNTTSVNALRDTQVTLT